MGSINDSPPKKQRQKRKRTKPTTQIPLWDVAFYDAFGTKQSFTTQVQALDATEVVAAIIHKFPGAYVYSLKLRDDPKLSSQRHTGKCLDDSRAIREQITQAQREGRVVVFTPKRTS